MQVLTQDKMESMYILGTDSSWEHAVDQGFTVWTNKHGQYTLYYTFICPDTGSFVLNTCYFDDSLNGILEHLKDQWDGVSFEDQDQALSYTDIKRSEVSEIFEDTDLLIIAAQLVDACGSGYAYDPYETQDLGELTDLEILKVLTDNN